MNVMVQEFLADRTGTQYDRLLA